MQNIAIHKVQELSADARQIVEQVLGRPLQDDEEVSIMAVAPHDDPKGSDRQLLARKLEQRIKKTAKRAQSLPEDQVEEIVNEALDYARLHSR